MANDGRTQALIERARVDFRRPLNGIGTPCTDRSSYRHGIVSLRDREGRLLAEVSGGIMTVIHEQIHLTMDRGTASG